jgi:hypothetical protein
MGAKQYPRVYLVEAQVRRAGNAVALSPLAVVISVGFLSLAGLTNKPVTPVALLVMCFLGGLWAFLLARPAHRRVVLHEDAIEVVGWFSARKLNRGEILGRRMEGGQSVYGPAHYVIVPVDTAARVLRFPSRLHVDEEFRSWMDGIPKVAKDGSFNS